MFTSLTMTPSRPLLGSAWFASENTRTESVPKLRCKCSLAGCRRGGVYRMPTDDEVWSTAEHARPKAPDKFAANGKKPTRHGGS